MQAELNSVSELQTLTSGQGRKSVSFRQFARYLDGKGCEQSMSQERSARSAAANSVQRSGLVTPHAPFQRWWTHLTRNEVE